MDNKKRVFTLKTKSKKYFSTFNGPADKTYSKSAK